MNQLKEFLMLLTSCKIIGVFKELLVLNGFFSIIGLINSY